MPFLNFIKYNIMRVHLSSLGCRLNEAELEGWARQFQAQGHHITPHSKEADLVILNSCAVTQAAVRKSRQQVRRIHRANPKAKVVVSGCYASLQPEEAANLLGVDLVVANTDKHNLYQRVQEEQLITPVLTTVATETISDIPETTLFARGRQRAFVKVQDGCRHQCTFCIVTVARGAERSRPVQAIIDEINLLHHQGIHEVILTGVHLGGYGSDLHIQLDQLIQSVLDNTDIPRIRLGSLEPWDLPGGFFDLFQNPRLMPHLHLPLQSGSASVLRRMARRCSPDQFAQLVKQGRQTIPDLNITTDIIVGFPGESEEEWQQSYSFIEATGFGHIHIFSYSAREGTRAANLPNQVPPEIKKNRNRSLHQLAAKLRLDVFAQNLEKEFPVLWENPVTESNGITKLSGYTPNYLRVTYKCPQDDASGNQIRIAHLDRIATEEDHLIATLR